MIREGSDITLVGWGAQLSIMEQACFDAEKVTVVAIVPCHVLNSVTCVPNISIKRT